MGDIEYIQPNEIGYTELSEQEQKIIRKSEKNNSNLNTSDIYIIIRLLLHTPAIIYLIFNSLNIKTLIIILLYILILWGIFGIPRTIKYTASAYGTVVQKDIIIQKVIARKKYRYKRYIAQPTLTDKPTVEQEFYYLTLRLADDRYVRYVNCLREDFISVSEGDTVLAVCYGFNEIKGYII